MHARDGHTRERPLGVDERDCEHDRQRHSHNGQREDDEAQRKTTAACAALTFSRRYCHMERPPDRVPTRTPNVILSTASETNEMVTSFRSIRVIFVTGKYYAICGPHHSCVTNQGKKKARHPRGAGSAGPSRRTGQRAGRPEP